MSNSNNPLPDTSGMPDAVFAFNELRSCADLQRMVSTGQLNLNPDFQRGVVWRNPAQTMFIDSLAKEIPIPSLCIAHVHETGERLVIDGLQRITSINKFLTDPTWKLDTGPEGYEMLSDLSGKKVSEIRKNNERLVNEIENRSIPITILRCQALTPNTYEYLYQVFERLNSGGLKLTAQEIRNCIFNGPFNSLLKKLARNSDFIHVRSLLLRSKNSRFKDEETILRFFAFHDDCKSYDGKFTRFLNRYMRKKKAMADQEKINKTALFENTLKLLKNKVLPQTKDNIPREKTNAAFLEGLLIGISHNIEQVTLIDALQAQKFYHQLRKHKLYTSEALSHAVTDKTALTNRLATTIKIFSGKND